MQVMKAVAESDQRTGYKVLMGQCKAISAMHLTSEVD